MPTIHINGESREISDALSVADLVRELQLVPEQIAIELNRDILPRDRYSQTALGEGDRLEVVTFVGGG